MSVLSKGPNILDKTDKSRFVEYERGVGGVFSGVSDSGSDLARTRYKWSEPGAPGRYMLIPRESLNIDGRYQRDSIGMEKVARIAANWDWMLFGVLLVVERPDGSFWVYDGGHRTRASFRRDDTTHLPCLVFFESSLSDEAKAFINANTMSSAVSSYQKQIAGVCANDPVSMQIDALLSEVGLEMVKGGAGAMQIGCVGILNNLIKLDSDVAHESVRFLAPLCYERSLPGEVLRGLFHLIRRFRDKERPVDILKKYGAKLSSHSIEEMHVRIRQFKVESGTSGSKAEACGLLKIVNRKSRRRLVW